MRTMLGLAGAEKAGCNGAVINESTNGPMNKRKLGIELLRTLDAEWRETAADATSAQKAMLRLAPRRRVHSRRYGSRRDVQATAADVLRGLPGAVRTTSTGGS